MEPGNQADRGPEEHYESAPFQLPAGARPRRIEWEAEVPATCWVRACVRTAATREGLAGAAWVGAYESGAAIGAEVGAGCWLQYCLALGARNGCGTPRVQRVTVAFG